MLRLLDLWSWSCRLILSLQEERVGACQRPACKAGHHYLLHMEKHKAKAKQGERPPAKSSGAVQEPTPTEEHVQ
jgi:hypothetical protein